MPASAIGASIADVARTIRNLRGQRVLLDADLAAVYGVTTKRLNEQVRRNLERFPRDFIFQLTNQEVMASRSQIATLNSGREIRGRAGRKLAEAVQRAPYTGLFTGHAARQGTVILSKPRHGQQRQASPVAITRLSVPENSRQLLP